MYALSYIDNAFYLNGSNTLYGTEKPIKIAAVLLLLLTSQPYRAKCYDTRSVLLSKQIHATQSRKWEIVIKDIGDRGLSRSGKRMKREKDGGGEGSQKTCKRGVRRDAMGRSILHNHLIRLHFFLCHPFIFRIVFTIHSLPSEYYSVSSNIFCSIYFHKITQA